MKVREIPGQLELVFETPTLTVDQRAEIGAYIVAGWQGMGECRSVADDSCFPEPGQATAAAVDRCSFCPVRRSCLASALANDEEFGVWGATTEVQRDVIRTDIAAGVPIVDALDGSTLLPELLWRQAS
ncbi:WhiB family transcriptional regulator [Kribbella sp. CA-245084]|uniref:WhiB family transcriptional regulator n=1 Tax=Kribbella sp. CA-245084 TaxID=3239940 RepID=UPI003D8D12A1